MEEIKVLHKKKVLAPKLRFKEFDEGSTDSSYKKYLFDNIFLFSTGKNIKQNEASPQFETPCVRYGELYHMYNEVINEVFNRTNINKSELLFSQGDEILLPSAGEDPLDIGSASALTIKNVAIGRTINILKPLKANIYSQIYVAYFINQKLRRKISTLAKGVSISNVYNSDLKTLEIILPTLPEQQKIASFLSAVDEKLQQLTRKKELLEQYKKGVMQQLFSGKLRFKPSRPAGGDENGKAFPKWENQKLENIATIQKGEQLNSSELTEVGLYPALNGGVNPSGYTDEWNMDENVVTISEGGNSCGYINLAKTKFWCGGHCYALIELNKSILNNYLFHFLKRNELKIMRLRVGSGLPNIQKKDLNKFKIIVPSFEEQKKIANYLSNIDNKIESVTKQITQTQTFKKGLLQQMFV